MENKVTIYTIAEELGVTPTSVSRAFNPNAKLSAEKRELILKTAAKYHFQPNRMASRLSKRENTIGVLIYSYFEPYYGELIRGIEDAYLELKDYKVKYDLRLLDSKRHPAAECNAVLDEFIVKGYDGIIISDLLNDSNLDKINEIYETNPNIVFINFDSAKLNRLFASVHDFECASKTAAELLAISLQKSSHKRILLLTEDVTAFAQMRAQNAFCDEAERQGLAICGIFEVKEISDGLDRKDPEIIRLFQSGIDGIFVSCGNSLSVCRFVAGMPKGSRPFLVTYDVFPELNRYIREGVVTATVFQNSYMQAKTAFTKLFFHLLDGQSSESTVYTKFELVMKNNLGLYE